MNPNGSNKEERKRLYRQKHESKEAQASFELSDDNEFLKDIDNSGVLKKVSKNFKNEKKRRQKSTSNNKYGIKMADMFGVSSDDNFYACFGRLEITDLNKTEKNLTNIARGEESLLFFDFEKHEANQKFNSHYFFGYKKIRTAQETKKRIETEFQNAYPRTKAVIGSMFSGKSECYKHWKQEQKDSFSIAMHLVKQLLSPKAQNSLRDNIVKDYSFVDMLSSECEALIKRLGLRPKFLSDKSLETRQVLKCVDFLTEKLPFDANELKTNIETYYSHKMSRKDVTKIKEKSEIIIEKLSKSKQGENVKVDEITLENNGDLFKCTIFQTIKSNPEQFTHIFVDSSWINNSKIMLTIVLGMSKVIKAVAPIKQDRRKYIILFVFMTRVNDGLQINVTESAQIYTQMFKKAKKVFPNIKSVSCDFSKSFKKAIEACELNMIGCFFHYKQSVMRALRNKKFNMVSDQLLSIIKLHPFQPDALFDMIEEILHKPDVEFATYIIKEFPKNLFAFKKCFSDPTFEDYFVWTNNASERQFGNFKCLQKNSIKSLSQLSNLIINFIQKQNNFSKNKKDFIGGDNHKMSLSQRLFEGSEEEMLKAISNYRYATKLGVFKAINAEIGKIKIINTIQRINIDQIPDFEDGESLLEPTIVDGLEADKVLLLDLKNRINRTPTNVINSLIESTSKLKRQISVCFPSILRNSGLDVAANMLEKGRIEAYSETIRLQDELELIKTKQKEYLSSKNELVVCDILKKRSHIMVDDQKQNDDQEANSDDIYIDSCDDEITYSKPAEPNVQSQKPFEAKIKIEPERKVLTSGMLKRVKQSPLDIQNTEEIKQLKKRIEAEKQARLEAEEEARANKKALIELQSKFEEFQKMMTKGNSFPGSENSPQEQEQNKYQQAVSGSILVDIKTHIYQNTRNLENDKQHYIEKINESGEKRFSENKVSGPEGEADFLSRDDREFDQNNNNMLIENNSSQIQETGIKKENEDYTQNLNVANFFGIIFGTDKPEQPPKKKLFDSNDESMANEHSKATKAKTNKRGRPKKKNSSQYLENLKKAHLVRDHK